jgi:hypothetical protein
MSNLEIHVESLFKRLEILALPCEYILSLKNYTVNNQERFQPICATYRVNTRNKYQFQTPSANLSRFQKSTYYAGVNFQQSVIYYHNSYTQKTQFKVALDTSFTLLMNF